MALKKAKKKGLFMTVLVLILFLLILGELFSFALLNMSYNNLDTSLAQGSGSINYGKEFQSGATLLASSSLSTALSTLASYEFNSSMRKANLISNTTQYLTYLVVNGTLPNVAVNSIPANYLAKSMGNLTLSSYNTSVQNSFRLGGIRITINQSKPRIFQTSPYSLSITYVENVALNSTSGKFTYHIPVNATISLNNTPDLYYYQQGIATNVKFGSLSNLTSLIGGINASTGNFLGTAYGPVYNVPTGASGLTCANLASMITANEPAFAFAPYNQMLILSTSNAIGITAGASSTQCANEYGGLITYSVNSLTLPPATAWVQYPSATGLLSNIRNGQQVLILGNTLSTYNIQNLLNAAGNGYYFASPFSTSYLDRAQGSVTNQNPTGIFSLSNYNTQGVAFNGLNIIGTQSVMGTGFPIDKLNPFAITVAAWIYPTASTGTVEEVADIDCPAAGSRTFVLGAQAGTSSNNIEATFYLQAGSTWNDLPASNVMSLNKWHLIVGTYNYATQALYVDGAASNLVAITQAMPVNPGNLYIGERGPACGNGLNFVGQVADVQVYNTTLTSEQIQQLYQEGISGIPIGNAQLSGWWPLNGNSNDYSGQNSIGIPTNIVYDIAQNYSRDVIFSTTVPTSLSPIPGLLNCNSNIQCSNTNLAHAYLGYNPLELTQGFQQVADFNGFTQNSYIQVGNPANALNLYGTNSYTISAWIYPTAAPQNAGIFEVNQCDTAAEMFFSGNNLYFRRGGDFANDLSVSFNAINTWVNVVGVFDGTNNHIYLNGTQKGQNGPLSTGISSYPNANAFIGQLNNGCNNYDIQGSIANVQVYDIGLSASQAKQLYLEGIQGLPISTNALAGWWPLNGNSKDFSGYGENGTNVNVNYPYFSGTYNAPGLSTISTAANEWQAIGIPRSGG
ncbi:MAG: LamG domain-containing protein [Candidatus Micrarchaeales archaeon]